MNFLKLLAPILIAIFTIFSDYKFSYLDGIKQSIAKFISPLYLVTNLPSQLYVWINEQGVTKVFLLNQNKQLKSELIRLKVDLQDHNALLLKNQKLTQLLKSRYQLDQKKFILARVGSISQSRLKKQIVINKGSNDGIKIGQTALGANGILGQITQATPFYSSILLVTDPTQHIPVKSQRNGIRGIGKGLASRQNKLLVRFIEPGLDVKIGDIFLSSAVGSKFPADYPVGQVIRIEKHTDSPFLYIELTPIQSTKALEFVLVGN
ncbi:Rod shape-determining protein MreC [uncultured Candidatus Thioglobus sp.]|nr:Rod shape-determining protein MreC [uncultured Candidatus Thioglobus sp.]